eukprot:842755-Pyramimonas_sp.AAC.1
MMTTEDAEPGDLPQGSAGKHALTAMVPLGIIAFLVNCKPSEPYLTRYLEEVKGFSDEELGTYVWPYYTYGSVLALIPLGLAAEVWGYQKTILFGLLCREATRIVLIYGTSLAWMATMQVTFAIASQVTETIFFAYVYMVVDSSRFKSTTAFVQACHHIGNVAGSALGQFLVSYTRVAHNLTALFYISWFFTTAGFAVFLSFVPPPIHEPP